MGNSNKNNQNEDNKYLDEKSDDDIVININPTKLLFTFILGWVALPLLLQRVISSELFTVYIMWFYAFFNVKVVCLWAGHLLKAPIAPSNIFKLNVFGKILNIIYVLLNLAIQICLLVLFINYVYVNQIESLLILLLTIVQPLLSDLTSAIGNALLFK